MIAKCLLLQAALNVSVPINYNEAKSVILAKINAIP
jgi:hypothetical protein